MAKRDSNDEALILHHEKTLWAHFVNIFLGVWLIIAPAWMGTTQKALYMSEYISGFLIIVFSFLALSRKRILAPWIVCFVGFWLEFAPLLFWAPNAAIYLNDTLVGILVIACSILIPGLPGVIEDKGHEIPPGWTYNPSAWIQRIPVITLGCVGWFISRYLAAYQLGYIDHVWDPIFGDGTKMVITSSVAHFLPVPDAGLGALAYTIEALMGCKGGEARWRTMPWMVVIFAFLVVPVGIVSIVLVILQPVLVGYWCFLCLLAAFSMLIMVVLTLDEMMAVIQFLHLSVKQGKPFWRTFFKGGDIPSAKHDHRTPTFHASPLSLIASLRYGIGFQWNLFISVLLGAYLMFTPSLFGILKPLADSDHIIGALSVVVAMISLAEVTRTLRFILIPFGLWVALSTWFIAGHTSIVDINHFVVGILLILFSFPRGKIRESYGTLTDLIK